jgi:hypothetical protein
MEVRDMRHERHERHTRAATPMTAPPHCDAPGSVVTAEHDGRVVHGISEG